MNVDRSFKVERLDATFGAVMTGLTISKIDDATFEAIYATWLEYALLVLPNQFLSHDEQIAFARRFGDLEFELAPLSNVRSDGTLRLQDDSDDVVKILKGNMDWHADSTYMPIQAKGAVFTAHVVPKAGGETEWADMRAAYEELDPKMQRRVSVLSAHHSLTYSQAKVGHTHRDGSAYSGYGFNDQPPLRPLVKRHPETGRTSLLIGRHAYGIPGMRPQESETFLQELVDAACQPPRVIRHEWSAGDLVVWDNRCLLHRGRPWDMNEPRVMFHSRIAGDRASESSLPRL